MYYDYLCSVVKSLNLVFIFCVKIYDWLYYMVVLFVEVMCIWMDVIVIGVEGYI